MSLSPLMLWLLLQSLLSSGHPTEASGYTSIFLTRSHGLILPCLCLYLEFLLVHPNPPHSPGELSLLQLYYSLCYLLQEAPGDPPSEVGHPLFCQAIIVLLHSILQGNGLFSGPCLFWWHSRGRNWILLLHEQHLAQCLAQGIDLTKGCYTE